MSKALSTNVLPRVAFVNGAASLAKRICDDEGAPNCARYIGYIQDGLNLIFIYQAYAHGAVAEGNNGQQGSQQDGSVKRDVAAWDTILKDGGYNFDTVEHIDITNLSPSKRSDDENDDDANPILTHRSIIRNLTCSNSSTASDVAFNHFSNGAINMDFAGDLGNLPSTIHPTNNLEKRYDGAGFKISWTSRIHSQLTRSHQNSMSYAIAKDWANRAVHTDEGDYMGLVKTGHTANFYFRIIPETKGFGLNYESVNVCGGMAGFL